LAQPDAGQPYGHARGRAQITPFMRGRSQSGAL